jgi:hypothetical protein
MMLTPRSWIGRRPAAIALCGVVIAAALIGPAPAEEVTVRNDSFESGGSAMIVGDFVPGEHAGVRLTSPCNGSIVAVQIGWLSFYGGSGYSLEEAIHIYDGSTFPVPGTELETLEGPVLTDGVLNEFRYLDPNQLVPLNVPVSAGQQFYVTLEFANGTHIGEPDYTASVFRDLDGCQSGGNVLYAIPGGWMDFCGYLAGDLVIRAVVDCPGATGACCHADGTCDDGVEEENCQAFGDTWHEGLPCAEITCNPRGACCVGGGCLQLVEQPLCVSVSGTYAGDGTDCDDDVCVQGACCMPNGQCLENFGFECAAIGGDFLGPGSTCDPNPCPQPQGACCFDLTCVPDQTEDNCSAAGGAWGGAWTDCGDENENNVPDGCETCFGDANLDGHVDLADLGALLAHYGQTGDLTWYDGDFNGDGTVNLSDLGELLARYGLDCP